MSNPKYMVTSTPHTRSNDSIEKIMIQVLIALAPATVAGVFFFGFRALLLILLCISSSVFFEWLFQHITKKPSTIGDFSAAVTGLLLAFNIPASAPFWLPIVGCFFAIVIVKQLFGGLGQNFMNPALAGRAFLLAAFAQPMTNWTKPVLNPLSLGIDAVATATPLAMLKESGLVPTNMDYINILFGNVGGSIGETCAVAIILGGIYLIYKNIITWRIPATYILTVFILSFICGRTGLLTGYPLYEVLAGGVLLGAFFMATDYSSSPVTPVGQLIMGFGCGLLTVIIRVYGGYPEGVSYSILLMNLVVPLIDRYTKPRVFGVTKKGAKKSA